MTMKNCKKKGKPFEFFKQKLSDLLDIGED